MNFSKGAYTHKHEQIIKEFTDSLDTVYLDRAIVEKGAEFYRKYRKEGITLSDIDCLIMATASERQLLIVTRNVRHYPETSLLSEFSRKFLIS